MPALSVLSVIKVVLYVAAIKLAVNGFVMKKERTVLHLI
jgi:hypothetical protein